MTPLLLRPGLHIAFANPPLEWDVLKSSLPLSDRLTRDGRLHDDEFFSEIAKLLPQNCAGEACSGFRRSANIRNAGIGWAGIVPVGFGFMVR